MNNGGLLLDVNVLVALTDDQHIHHELVTRWFVEGGDANWGTCPFTEAGFVRITANPKGGRHSIAGATEVLRLLAGHGRHRFWPVLSDWATLSAPFKERIFGHQQVTDAYLLGLAVQQAGVLVTMDRGIGYLAGREFGGNLLVLG